MANTEGVPGVRADVAAAATHADDSLALVATRIRDEYLEMPGLSLTFRQAMRLWHLDQARCRLVLDRLVDARFLTQTRHGVYRRLEG